MSEQSEKWKSDYMSKLEEAHRNFADPEYRKANGIEHHEWYTVSARLRHPKGRGMFKYGHDYTLDEANVALFFEYIYVLPSEIEANLAKGYVFDRYVVWRLTWDGKPGDMVIQEGSRHMTEEEKKFVNWETGKPSDGSEAWPLGTFK